MYNFIPPMFLNVFCVLYVSTFVCKYPANCICSSLILSFVSLCCYTKWYKITDTIVFRGLHITCNLHLVIHTLKNLDIQYSLLILKNNLIDGRWIYIEHDEENLSLQVHQNCETVSSKVFVGISTKKKIIQWRVAIFLLNSRM